MIIYKITHIESGKCYIGQTVKPLHKRWLEHCVNGRCVALSRAIKKYGRNAFYVESLGTFKTIESLNNAEKQAIIFYNSIVPNGYNIREGGGNRGKLHKTTKRKIALAHLGVKRKPFTKEWRHKMSLAKKGKKSNWLGRHPTEETKQKISESNRFSIKRLKTRIFNAIVKTLNSI